MERKYQPLMLIEPDSWANVRYKCFTLENYNFQNIIWITDERLFPYQNLQLFCKRFRILVVYTNLLNANRLLSIKPDGVQHLKSNYFLFSIRLYHYCKALSNNYVLQIQFFLLSFAFTKDSHIFCCGFANGQVGKSSTETHFNSF